MIVGWVHDVWDHKYKDKCISWEELLLFLESVSSNPKTLLNIAEDVSFSKHFSGQRRSYVFPYNIVLNIASDSDWLEALGQIGLERCMKYSKILGRKIPEDVVKHCEEKPLILLSGGYIVTEYA